MAIWEALVKLQTVSNDNGYFRYVYTIVHNLSRLVLYAAPLDDSSWCSVAVVCVRDADQWYVLANQMGDKIKMMSFGQDLLDESQLFTGVSITHREQGGIGPAYKWAQAAIKVHARGHRRGSVMILKCNFNLHDTL